MQDVCEPFRSKHVTILGLGLLGRGVGDAEFLARCGAQVIVTDIKDEKELAESVARLKEFSNVQFHLGGHREEDFSNCDLVLKAAGVPLDSHEIALAHKQAVPVAMSTALFAKYAMEIGAIVVGITGTRGKSTTTQMIYEVLRRLGKQVLLGGNVRGISTLALLPEVTPETTCVLELDSWQLQGFGDLRISPDISVFTNFMPDHLNYYAGDMERYFEDKANSFRFQKPGDSLFVGESILKKISAVLPPVAPHVPETIPDDWRLQLSGAHNRENASFALAALRALKIPDEESKKGLSDFEAVEGRLQFVCELNGAKIYNDNNATTPDATIAALKSLDDGTKKIILIAGGADKKIDMHTALYEIAKTCKRVILLAGSGTDRIAPLMTDYSIFDDLERAVREAVATARPGDVVLFSPAFASFGMFKNEYERGDAFLRIVRSL